MCSPMTAWHYAIIRMAFAVAVNRVFPNIRLDETKIGVKWSERGDVSFQVSADHTDGRTFQGEVRPQWIQDYSRWCLVELRGHQIPVTGRIQGEKPGEVWYVGYEYSKMTQSA